MTDLTALGALEQARLVRRREASVRELVDACIARVERLNDAVNAVCTPTFDAARAAADRAQAALDAGDDVGPLHGVPFLVKDLLSTAGVRTTYGSRVYADLVPDEDDVAVERLLNAGAIMIGKTNTPEFGYQAVCDSPLFGASRNPWNVDRTTGGSSGGSAAAVAAGMAALALGSDGGGSLRIPSSLCGTVSLKPTFGLVPAYPAARDPSLPGGSSWETLDHVGPMARDVHDVAASLAVVAGFDPRDRHSTRVGFDYDPATLDAWRPPKRVAFTLDWGWARVEPEVRDLVRSAVDVFAGELGCDVEEAHPPFTYTQDDFWSLVASEADLSGLRRLVDEHGDAMSASVVDLVQRPWTAEDMTDAKRERQRVTNHLNRFFSRYDLFLTPTLAVAAFGHGKLGPERIDGADVPANAWIPFTHPFNLSGQPAISVPAGRTSDGLPVGLQIAGRRFEDLAVLQAARAFEQARPWTDDWPDLVTTLADGRHATKGRASTTLRSGPVPIDPR